MLLQDFTGHPAINVDRCSIEAATIIRIVADVTLELACSVHGGFSGAFLWHTIISTKTYATEKFSLEIMVLRTDIPALYNYTLVAVDKRDRHRDTYARAPKIELLCGIDHTIIRSLSKNTPSIRGPARSVGKSLLRWVQVG